MLLPHLEGDTALRDAFFKNLDILFYAGAALSQDLWDRLEKLSIDATGRRVVMLSAWGSTETTPGATWVHWPIERAGVIGLPGPEITVKLVPSESKDEILVKGPNVTPGYLKRPDLTEAAFDEDGFYRIGDAARLADANDPLKGLIFDGRVAEDFKLTSGTWVNTGQVRITTIAAAEPVFQDVVVAGHDRDYVAVLAWLNLVRCRAIAGVDWHDDTACVGTYEEWQESGGLQSARLSSILFRRNDALRNGFEWVHLHETWLAGHAPSA